MWSKWISNFCTADDKPGSQQVYSIQNRQQQKNKNISEYIGVFNTLNMYFILFFNWYNLNSFKKNSNVLKASIVLYFI